MRLPAKTVLSLHRRLHGQQMKKKLFGACLWPFTFYVFNFKLEQGQISITCPTRRSVLLKWIAIRKRVQKQAKIHRLHRQYSMDLQVCACSCSLYHQDSKISCDVQTIFHISSLCHGAQIPMMLDVVLRNTEQSSRLTDQRNDLAYQDTNQFGQWYFLTVYLIIHETKQQKSPCKFLLLFLSESLVTSAMGIHWEETTELPRSARLAWYAMSRKSTKQTHDPRKTMHTVLHTQDHPLYEAMCWFILPMCLWLFTTWCCDIIRPNKNR